jgi:hypothetical protein
VRYTLKIIICNIIFHLFFVRSAIIAQEPDTTNPGVLKEKHFRHSLIALPVAFYTPETRWGGGLVGLYNFYTKKNFETRPSNVAFYAYYTQNKQMIIRSPVSLFLPSNNYWLRLNIEYYKYPELFYGIGNDTKKRNESLYTPRFLKFEPVLMKKIRQHLFLGVQYEFMNYEILKTESGSLLSDTSPRGVSGGILSGVGITLRNDSRDNTFYASEGHYYEFQVIQYSGFYGSDYDYWYININLRDYITVFSKDVLAMQFYHESNSGDVPFYKLARLGGDMRMRGYFKGRYRDKHYSMFQAEYRKHIFWRIGAVAFAGIGDVSPRALDITASNLKYSIGMGLRLTTDEREKVNIRFDVAFGKKSSGIYLTAQEAF